MRWGMIGGHCADSPAKRSEQRPARTTCKKQARAWAVSEPRAL